MADTPPPAKPYARLEGWIWALIYAGLFAVVLGIATGRESTLLGWLLVVPGTVLTVVGAVLIYVRSRLGDKPKA